MASGDIIRIGGGFDPSKHAPIHIEQAHATQAANTYQTVVNLTGKGFLTKAVHHSSNNFGIRITIDNVVVYESTWTGSGQFIGVFLEEHVFTTPTYLGTRVGASIKTAQGMKVAGLPHVHSANDLNDGSLGILPQPLFFSKSLKVEVRSNYVGSSTLTTVLGGIG